VGTGAQTSPTVGPLGAEPWDYPGRLVSVYDFELSTDAAEGVVVVVLSGELDLTNARELEERLDRSAPPDALLVVDLNRVVFIDSAALHVLFKLARRRGRERFTLLVESDAAVARTLEIVGMKDAAPIVGSLDELELAPSA
jgi:anti-anti-sigma factor